MYRTRLMWGLMVGAVIVGRPATAVSPADSPHLQLAQEYIRQLGELEDLRSEGEAELKDTKGSPFSSMIHYSTRVQIALQDDIAALKLLPLAPPSSDTVGLIQATHEQRSVIFGEMRKIAAKMMSGPEPGVNYGALAAQMPQLRAQLESIDESYVKLSVLIFGTLIDMKPDSAGHASHLIITRAQRQDLARQLRSSFGAKLRGQQQNGIVAAAGVLDDYLHKGWKGSDEPW